VHAWAKSRAGFNSVLTIRPLSPDGRHVTGEGVTAFDGRAAHPTIEGPKFYKRNGYYYIFAPAGGVSGGWQTVLRARHVLGPYEDRIVLAQGKTTVNGPHQGAWVDTSSGQSWFLHFQDRGPYGRVVHLQPMAWRDDWPVIGSDADGDGTGEPVQRHRKPEVARAASVAVPQTSDDFAAAVLGPQWQWNANGSTNWWSLSAMPGALRLWCVPASSAGASLWSQPNLLMQKFPGPEFTVTTTVDGAGLRDGERAGLVVLGADYAYIGVTREAGRLRVVRATCLETDAAAGERVVAGPALTGSRVHLRVAVGEAARCEFAVSPDGARFSTLGEAFTTRQDRWVGVRVGVFALASGGRGEAGTVDVDAFLVE
jgi:beta-xylosidase